VFSTYVHAHTTDIGPAVALDLVLVVGTTSLEDGLVGTATTSDNADGSTAVLGEDLLGTRGKANAGLASVAVVGEDGSIVARRAGERATVTDLLLDVADDGTLGHRANGEHVANGKGGLLASVDELASVGALSGNEELLVELVVVGVVEDDLAKRVQKRVSTRKKKNTGTKKHRYLGEGCTTAGVVDDLAHNTLEVAVAIGRHLAPHRTGEIANCLWTYRSA